MEKQKKKNEKEKVMQSFDVCCGKSKQFILGQSIIQYHNLNYEPE